MATPAVSGPDGRLTRRRLRVHDIMWQPLPGDGNGGFVMPDDAVLMMQLPSPDRPDMAVQDVLQAIEDLVLGSRNVRRAVVIGPASALTDRLRGHAAAVRDGIVRTDRVRAVVRLPAGLLPGKPRSRLAVWCLGPVPVEISEEAAAGGPRTLVADLADTVLDDAAISELVTDLLAGMQHVQALVAHTPVFVRAVRTRTLRARTGDLVEPAPAPTRTAATAELISRITTMTDNLSTPLAAPAFQPPLPRAVPPERTVTVGAALRRRELRILPGLRIRPGHLDETASVRVIGPPELTGEPKTPRCAIDRLVLAAKYPTSRFTEPGDVVFCTSPRPSALVDTDGGSVVAFPARILRSRSDRLCPRVLAADINTQPATAKTWRAWSLRPVPDDQAEALTAILDHLDRHRADLTARLATLDQLAATLVAGTASGTLNLTPQH